MLAGPMYAIASAGWTTINLLQPLIDPMAYQVFSWTVLLLSWSGMALIIGWIPLLFPTGHLPGPRWRAPAALTLILLGVGLFAAGAPPRRVRGVRPARTRSASSGGPSSSSRSSMRSPSPCLRRLSWGSQG